MEHTNTPREIKAHDDETFGHGGNWAGYQEEHGGNAVDFSMNVNPLGIPEGVAKAIASGAADADRYPDPKCRRLIRALADHEEVSREHILCGNGAADIIDRIALAFALREEKRAGLAVVTAPTFSEYGRSLKRCGWEIRHLKLDEQRGFRIGEDDLEKIEEILSHGNMGADPGSRSRMLFLCEPNNPTGVTTDMDRLIEMLRICRSTGTVMVVDECFNGFLDEPDRHSLKKFLPDNPQLIILKAFTKLYGMAGVRLGYCLCSDIGKLEAIRNAGQPWNVSYLAEEAGLAALKEKDYVENARKLIKSERVWLKERLGDMGVEKIYGEGNYILFQWLRDVPAPGKVHRPEVRHDRGALKEELEKVGILIRSCSNYEGLGPGWYRIAVRGSRENQQLIRAMEEIKNN